MPPPHEPRGKGEVTAKLCEAHIMRVAHGKPKAAGALAMLERRLEQLHAQSSDEPPHDSTTDEPVQELPDTSDYSTCLVTRCLIECFDLEFIESRPQFFKFQLYKYDPDDAFPEDRPYDARYDTDSPSWDCDLWTDWRESLPDDDYRN